MQLVRDDIISTKTGNLIDLFTRFFVRDITKFEAIRMSVVEKANPVALTRLFETPSNGHRPSNCTNAGFFVQNPSVIMVL